jgi:hypothetical protein
MSESLTYNTYFGKYMLVGLAMPTDPSTGETVSGFYYSLSDDLLHWSRWKVLMRASVPSDPNCGDPDPVRDPSVIDPSSTSRSFETVGKHAYLYFERLHVTFTSTFCYWPEDRDLVRIPIEFSGADQPPSPPPPAPGPSQAASPSPAPTAAAGTGTLSTRCLTARRDRARLLRLVQSTRRKLANARTKSAKTRYRRLLRARKRQLARARDAAAVAC